MRELAFDEAEKEYETQIQTDRAQRTKNSRPKHYNSYRKSFRTEQNQLESQD